MGESTCRCTVPGSHELFPVLLLRERSEDISPAGATDTTAAGINRERLSFRKTRKGANERGAEHQRAPELLGGSTHLLSMICNTDCR